MSKHKATQVSWLTWFKERQAMHNKNSMHLCYGKRCADHGANWYAWTAGRAL